MAQNLRGWIHDRSLDRIEKIEVGRNPKNRYAVGPELEGAICMDVFRRGKRLIFELVQDGDKYLVCHNAMSGYWDCSTDPWTFDYVEGKRTPKESDVRVKIHLGSGKVLRFHDSRLFGSLRVLTKNELAAEHASLGPDALSTPRLQHYAPTFNILDSAVFLSGKKPIKQLLLEQHRIAGLGNIYAVESLWLAGVRPDRPGNSLTTDEHQKITESIQLVLRAALDRSLDYGSLAVYRRQNCPDCGLKIEKIEVAKRSTYFCPTCQF